jgi:hypothetical protein
MMVAPEKLNIAATQLLDQGHREVSPRLIADMRPDGLALEMRNLLRTGG